MQRKYIDHDVRSHYQQLSTLAYEYLKQYRGDFSFLIECRDNLNENGYLGHAHIRGVLNCMLADPSVRNMPEPISRVFNARGAHPDHVEFAGPLKALPKRPDHFKLPTRWHYEFGVSNHARSYIVHRVDLERSVGTWYRESYSVLWTLYWRCGAGYSWKPEGRAALFGMDDAMLLVQTGNAEHIKHLTVGAKQRDWKWCRQCTGIVE